MGRQSTTGESRLSSVLQWSGTGRALVFFLAATSIGCLLAEMYGLCDMRTFTFAILIPSTVVLCGLAMLDRLRGDGRLWRTVVRGTLAGLVGAVAYDVFRLPFVFSDSWRLGRIGIPQMSLFKVFPRFGALILGEPLEQSSYSSTAHLIGWAYHFSNGAAFGVMFAALMGRTAGRLACGLPWAVLMAIGIEAGLLLSPYARFFAITLDSRFITVTLLAHVVFGLGLGRCFAWRSRRWSLAPSAA